MFAVHGPTSAATPAGRWAAVLANDAVALPPVPWQKPRLISQQVVLDHVRADLGELALALGLIALRPLSQRRAVDSKTMTLLCVRHLVYTPSKISPT